MLLIPSKVFLVLNDPVPPISRRTRAGVPLLDDDRSFEADSDGGHNCFGCAPGSNLELGAPALLSLTVTALGFGYFLPDAILELSA